MSAGTIIGLVVALATLVGTFVLGLLRFRHERSLADLSDARSILAEGAIELKRMADALDQLRSHLDQPLVVGGDVPDNAGEVIEGVNVRGRAVETLLAGLRVRFDENAPVVANFDGAREAAQKLVWLYEMSVFISIEDDRCRDQDWEESKTLCKRFDDYREEYLRAAQRAVGSSLPD